jgi:hypothetical protein
VGIELKIFATVSDNGKVSVRCVLL